MQSFWKNLKIAQAPIFVTTMKKGLQEKILAENLIVFLKLTINQKTKRKDWA